MVSPQLCKNITLICGIIFQLCTCTRHANNQMDPVTVFSHITFRVNGDKITAKVYKAITERLSK